MTTQEAYLKFWGKAGGPRNGEPGWHSLAYHSLDVAAVAHVMLTHSPRRLEAVARLLQTNQDNARRLIVGLIAFHDVGKFSTGFQAKSAEAWPQSILGAWTPQNGGRHDELGSQMFDILDLKSVFEPAFESWLQSEIVTLWHSVTGHHGRPCPATSDLGLPGVTMACRDSLSAFARDCLTMLGPLDPLPEPPARHIAVMTWFLVGLTVVSDWIGSNRNWFPYTNPKVPLESYWKNALGKAEFAVQRAGILPTAIAVPSPAHLLPDIANRLSPLQKLTAELQLPKGPMLAIIEDVTGSGKTEAAFLLANRLLADRRADGLFFALPTMATANAIFDRMRPIYRRLFGEEELPSLVLAHGKRALHQGFTDSILAVPGDDSNAYDGFEDGSGPACAAWIADDRRKAFLAHVGVGTIDQALLAVLPSKYQALRLWGLTDRILIIDEAHAYDAYMSREIETLLEFHGALGGSAIILSATLGSAQRRSLIGAYQKGLVAATEMDDKAEYPLLTLASRSGIAFHSRHSRSDRARSLPVRRISSANEAVDRIVDLAGTGASVAWIRNTVDDAIRAVELLEGQGLYPILLHARFAMGDRLKIEETVQRILGRKGGPAERQGYVVVGTQILEQSLDYDVDAMVTDLAPIDLMIQRAGRLWRHTERKHRPPSISGPELLVLSPDPEMVADADWYRAISPGSASVYDHHGLVWRSAKLLFEAGAITTPTGIRSLIEDVYGPAGFDDIPPPLLRASQEAEGKRKGARSHAHANLLDLGSGYAGAPQIWTQDTITPTRLGEPVTVFRLARFSDSGIAPFCGADTPQRSWALSEVNLRQSLAKGVPVGDSRQQQLVQGAKAAWPEWERELPLLLMEPDGGAWRGEVTGTGGKPHEVLYDRRIGLRLCTAPD